MTYEPEPTKPKLAILFWYYKEPEICVSRLQDLRRLNPQVPIYGLYGGSREDFFLFHVKLNNILDDNWCYPKEKTPHYKWKYGDKIIAEWYISCGKDLPWDSLIVAQWDLLARASFESGLGPFERDTVYLPGLRPMSEIFDSWFWVRPGSEDRDEYDKFTGILFEKYGFTGPYYACNFVSAIFPRKFLEQYACLDEEMPGFLEYKVPFYAVLWGFAVKDLPKLRLTWRDKCDKQQRVTVNAHNELIKTWVIFFEWLMPGGAKFFHPVFKDMPRTLYGWLALIAEKIMGLRKS